MFQKFQNEIFGLSTTAAPNKIQKNIYYLQVVKKKHTVPCPVHGTVPGTAVPRYAYGCSAGAGSLQLDFYWRCSFLKIQGGTTFM